MANFWDRVKILIKAHKITQEKFAEYLNIPKSTFYSWLKYNITPEVVTAYNIATILGVSVEYLVTGTDGRNVKQRMMQTEERKTTEGQIRSLVGKLREEVERF